MFTSEQLKFIRASLTQPNSAVPCADGGKTARVFLAVLDEIEHQEKALASPLKSVGSDAA